MKTRKTSFGFIMLRHVNSAQTDEYWKLAYESIRKYYSNLIVIIDDNSNHFLTSMSMKNVIVLQSEYPGSGELLPYYYYSKYKWFDQAVILHDSVFINKKINFQVHTYKFLWEFTEHKYDVPSKEKKLIRVLKNHDELMDLYETKQWKGCFGAMMAVNHSFLSQVDKLYDFSKLLPLVKTRDDRKGLERVIACMFQTRGTAVSIFGNIFKYGTDPFKYNYQDLMKRRSSLPVIKIWSGR